MASDDRQSLDADRHAGLLKAVKGLSLRSVAIGYWASDHSERYWLKEANGEYL
ncbi:MAG TPA: hypothetical protein VH913_15615 [Hyphomicrobiaceae bacterium]|jgi:hypothetical protein